MSVPYTITNRKPLTTFSSLFTIPQFLYTEFVKNFLRNPFQSPLSAYIDEISPSHNERQHAERAVQFVQEQIVEMSTQGFLLPLQTQELLIVGSHYRNTDLSPIDHIDVFLLLDPTLVNIHEKERTLQLATKNNFLNSCVDESLHLLPHKLIEALLQTFSQKFSSTISSMGQSVRILTKQFSLSIKVTPAFAWGDSFFIPAQHSELYWRRVSPQKEKQMLDMLNDSHIIIPLIRYMKRWNQLRNNESLTNYHIEAIAYLIFSEIPTRTGNIMEALNLYAKQMSKYIYKCPDPTNLDTPIHEYLHDNIDQWYLFMNRISELKQAITLGEKNAVQLITADVE